MGKYLCLFSLVSIRNWFFLHGNSDENKLSHNNATFCVKVFICVFFTLMTYEKKIPQIILPLQDFRQENRYGAKS